MARSKQTNTSFNRGTDDSSDAEVVEETPAPPVVRHRPATEAASLDMSVSSDEECVRDTPAAERSVRMPKDTQEDFETRRMGPPPSVIKRKTSGRMEELARVLIERKRQLTSHVQRLMDTISTEYSDPIERQYFYELMEEAGSGLIPQYHGDGTAVQTGGVEAVRSPGGYENLRSDKAVPVGTCGEILSGKPMVLVEGSSTGDDIQETAAGEDESSDDDEEEDEEEDFPHASPVEAEHAATSTCTERWITTGARNSETREARSPVIRTIATLPSAMPKKNIPPPSTNNSHFTRNRKRCLKVMDPELQETDAIMEVFEQSQRFEEQSYKLKGIPGPEEVFDYLGFPLSRKHWTKLMKEKAAAIKEKIETASRPGELVSVDWKVFAAEVEEKFNREKDASAALPRGMAQVSTHAARKTKRPAPPVFEKTPPPPSSDPAGIRISNDPDHRMSGRALEFHKGASGMKVPIPRYPSIEETNPLFNIEDSD